jgi:hypothetical protein
MGDDVEISKARSVWIPLALMSLAACSRQEVQCGEVEKRLYSQSELALLEIATKESIAYCGPPKAGCYFSVYKTQQGTTVRVSRLSSDGGRCLGAIGDEKFYSFDGAGNLVRVIDGL